MHSNRDWGWIISGENVEKFIINDQLKAKSKLAYPKKSRVSMF